MRWSVTPEWWSSTRLKLLQTIDQASPQKIQEVLTDRQVEESRILTEAAIFADKVAVDEETVRLRSHIAQFRGMLAEGSPWGENWTFNSGNESGNQHHWIEV